MTARLVSLMVLLVGGCAVRPTPTPTPPRWQTYADKGAFRVRGSSRSEPGPRLMRALERDPSVARVVAASGEPESVQVVTVHGTSRRIILTYTGSASGRPRRVMLDPSEGERTAGRPTPRRQASQRPVRPAALPSAEPGQAVATGGTPTASQRLECPIDPDRSDCRAFCSGGATQEWCR